MLYFFLGSPLNTILLLAQAKYAGEGRIFHRTMSYYMLHNAHHLCWLLISYSEYATDVNVLVARKAIQAVGKIALRVAARANTCADKLVSLLAMEIDYVTAETLISLASESNIK